MVPTWGVFVLGFALFASLALGVATSFLVVRRTKQPILWVTVPLFTFVWLAVGLALFIFGVRAARSSAPAPVGILQNPTGQAAADGR